MKKLAITAAAVLLSSVLVSAQKSKYLQQYMKRSTQESTIEVQNETITNQDFSGNPAPVIGVIAQTLESEMKKDQRFKGYKTYIMKSYVDWIEAQGARVVPIVPDDPLDVTRSNVLKMNGVLYPGGDGNYSSTGRFVFNIIKEMNDNGTYVPIWGTCAGMHELSSYVADEGWAVHDVYDMDSASLTLDFAYDNPEDIKIFQGLGPKAKLFETYNVTYNSHHWSLNPNKFDPVTGDKGLTKWFKPTSLSYMPAPDSRPFVASYETTGENAKYPFYGTQYHPEKAARIFSEEQAVNHSWLSIELNNHFAEFFVYDCRKNNNSYGNYSQVQKAIIQNHKLLVTNEWYDTVYLFMQANVLTVGFALAGVLTSFVF